MLADLIYSFTLVVIDDLTLNSLRLSPTTLRKAINVSKRYGLFAC